MAHSDLREFISKIEEERELLRVKAEVDWDGEIGATARRLFDREAAGINAPAVLFENIKEYPGAKFFTNTLASFRRYALALGLPKETHVRDIIETYRQRIKQPIKPLLLSTGPCKDNILMGDDVNLFKFPTPKWGPHDGHRYIGTFHSVIFKDPDSDWTNWGIYRMGIHHERSTGILIVPDQHIGLIYSKYEARNEPMSVAVAIGQDPVNNIVAASGFTGGVSEVDMAGALLQAPVELVKAETSDLTVPANAEIILEGEILPNKRKMEGPFAEYTGYWGGDRFPKPVFNVKCITHRNDPIHTGSMEGVPITDDNLMASISQSALAKWHLMDHVAVPGVKDVYFLPHCAGWCFCVVSAANVAPGLAQRIAFAIWGSKFGGIGGQADWIVVVDEDIDPSNIQQVLWSVVTRCDPARGVQIIKRRGSNPLLPKVSVEDRTQKFVPSSSIVIDAQFPFEWKKNNPASVPPVSDWNVYPRKVQERVLTLLGEK